MDRYAILAEQYLEADEVDYELRIRGLLGTQPDKEKRALVGKVLSGPDNPERSVVELTFNNEEEKAELQECAAKVRELGDGREGNACGRETRLVHLTYRIMRNQRVFNNYKSELGQIAIETQKLLDRYKGESGSIKNRTEVEVRDERATSTTDRQQYGAIRKEWTRQDLPYLEPRGTRGPRTPPGVPEDDLAEGHYHQRYVRPISPPSWQRKQREGDYEARYPTEYRPRYWWDPPRGGLPIHKWRDVQYDGSAESLSRFLLRIKQYAEAEGATEAELFRNRVHLFTGKAADWLATRPDLSSWKELTKELVEYIRDTTSDLGRLNRIREIRQGTEPTNTYITRCELAIQELSMVLTDTERIDLVIAGMRLELRKALAANIGIRTISQLREAARRVERLSGAQVHSSGPLLSPREVQYPGYTQENQQITETGEVLNMATQGTSQHTVQRWLVSTKVDRIVPVRTIMIKAVEVWI